MCWYCQRKLANIFITGELAQRLQGKTNVWTTMSTGQVWKWKLSRQNSQSLSELVPSVCDSSASEYICPWCCYFMYPGFPPFLWASFPVLFAASVFSWFCFYCHSLLVFILFLSACLKGLFFFPLQSILCILQLHLSVPSFFSRSCSIFNLHLIASSLYLSFTLLQSYLCFIMSHSSQLSLVHNWQYAYVFTRDNFS